jgi:hypothetical protein
MLLRLPPLVMLLLPIMHFLAIFVNDSVARSLRELFPADATSSAAAERSMAACSKQSAATTAAASSANHFKQQSPATD